MVRIYTRTGDSRETELVNLLHSIIAGFTLPLAPVAGRSDGRRSSGRRLRDPLRSPPAVGMDGSVGCGRSVPPFGNLRCRFGGGSSWRVRMVPPILRLGLGVTWIYVGILLKWLFPSAEGVATVARTGLVSLQVPMFLKLLGAAEAALGPTMLAGLWVRGMVVLQVGLLSAFTAIIGYTTQRISPR
jgi:hypothetical protein